MNDYLPIKASGPLKPNVIIIDATAHPQIKLSPDMFIRSNDGRPAIAVIRHKLEDLFGWKPDPGMDSVESINQ